MEQYGLEQVVEDLKTRGVKAGEESAGRIIEEARGKARTIVDEARAQADEIKEQAQVERKRTMAALKAEMQQAARVGLTAFRAAIEKSFLVPELNKDISNAIEGSGFLETAIPEMVKGFVAAGMSRSDIEVVLPEAHRQELAASFLQKLKERGADGVRVRFDDSLSFGFRIGPAGGGFTFDLTDDGFREILVKFLSPRFREAFYKS